MIAAAEAAVWMWFTAAAIIDSLSPVQRCWISPALTI
jgi:hypothetical protein